MPSRKMFEFRTLLLYLFQQRRCLRMYEEVKLKGLYAVLHPGNCNLDHYVVPLPLSCTYTRVTRV